MTTPGLCIKTHNASLSSTGENDLTNYRLLNDKVSKVWGFAAVEYFKAFSRMNELEDLLQ